MAQFVIIFRFQMQSPLVFFIWRIWSSSQIFILIFFLVLMSVCHGSRLQDRLLEISRNNSLQSMGYSMCLILTCFLLALQKPTASSDIETELDIPCPDVKQESVTDLGMLSSPAFMPVISIIRPSACLIAQITWWVNMTQLTKMCHFWV